MNEDDIDRALGESGIAGWYGGIATTIAQYGHQLISVFATPDDPGPPFTYTIGLSQKYGTELIIFGLRPEFAARALNTIAERLKTETIEAGAQMDIDFTFPLMFKIADERARGYVCQADQYYERDVPVLQVVLPDKNGKYPGDLEYDVEYMGPRQPLLYNP